MIMKEASSVYPRRSLFIWALFCVISGAIFLVYVFTSLKAGQGSPLMPLDDVYIHFQYARQMAMGQPYVYNPGLPATSGATSFLYPYILAAGYLMGFHDLQLGLWAMGVGAVTLAVGMWLVYVLVGSGKVPEWMGIATALGFGLNGAVAWHYMSGMETGIVITLSLWTLWEVIRATRAVDGLGGYGRLIAAATLLGLMRPEGGLLGVTAVAIVWWQGVRNERRWSSWWIMVIPTLAVGVQPLVNLALTGSAVASGTAAKSVLGTVPFYLDAIVGRVLAQFGRMWLEMGSGFSPREGLYILPLLLILAVLGGGRWLREPRQRWISLLLMMWFAGGLLMIATLDTAFWHFKRYQMPFIALLFPLGGWGVNLLVTFVPRLGGVVRGALAAGLAVTAVISSVQFHRYYVVNGDYVYAQPLQMARWLAANTEAEAVVAVHDVGMMRYMGGRTTLDMVGLTTAGAADYWRNGPGAVAEFLMEQQPDYVASYGDGHGYGLGLIAATGVYGDLLAGFPVTIDEQANVALAANFQGIYRPSWQLNPGQAFVGTAVQPYASDDWGAALDSINVGNLGSEHAHRYQWATREGSGGFATEVREMDYLRCQMVDCRLVDGGRLINEEEMFVMDGATGSDLALVTRLHPAFAGRFDVYANDTLIDTRWIPDYPGSWLEVATCIPAAVVGDDATIRIRTVPQMDNGFYEPFYHWLYQCPSSETRPESSLSTFQDGAIVLTRAVVHEVTAGGEVRVDLEWYNEGEARGDYKVFIHVYADTTEGPVAQLDMRPGGGALPPGNWVPGVLRDTFTVDLGNIPTGRYFVMMGLYDPVTFERLQPSAGDEQGRLMIGEVEIRG